MHMQWASLQILATKSKVLDPCCPSTEDAAVSTDKKGASHHLY